MGWKKIIIFYFLFRLTSSDDRKLSGLKDWSLRDCTYYRCPVRNSITHHNSLSTERRWPCNFLASICVSWSKFSNRFVVQDWLGTNPCCSLKMRLFFDKWSIGILFYDFFQKFANDWCQAFWSIVVLVRVNFLHEDKSYIWIQPRLGTSSEFNDYWNIIRSAFANSDAASLITNGLTKSQPLDMCGSLAWRRSSTLKYLCHQEWLLYCLRTQDVPADKM